MCGENLSGNCNVYCAPKSPRTMAAEKATISARDMPQRQIVVTLPCAQMPPALHAN